LAGEHGALLEAIEAGRPAVAESVIRHHLESATSWLIEHATAADDGSYALGRTAPSGSSDLG
jgi:DNA-binding FadR family transcriptional regulator